MKEIDLNVVVEEVTKQINETDYDITEWCGLEVAAMIVTNIYVTNDIMSGFGQDLRELDISIISSEQRISLIFQGASTYVKKDTAICKYESLDEDVYTILVMIQACFDKLNW